MKYEHSPKTVRDVAVRAEARGGEGVGKGWGTGGGGEHMRGRVRGVVGGGKLLTRPRIER